MKVLARKEVERLFCIEPFSITVQPYEYDGVISSVSRDLVLDPALVRYIQRL